MGRKKKGVRPLDALEFVVSITKQAPGRESFHQSAQRYIQLTGRTDSPVSIKWCRLHIIQGTNLALESKAGPLVTFLPDDQVTLLYHQGPLAIRLNSVQSKIEPFE